MVVWWVGAGCWGGAVHTWGRGRGCLQGDRREIRCRLSARCPAHRRILEGRRLFARCPTAGSRKVSLIRKVSSPPQDVRMCRLSARCPAAGCSNVPLIRKRFLFPARRYVWVLIATVTKWVSAPRIKLNQNVWVCKKQYDSCTWMVPRRKRFPEICRITHAHTDRSVAAYTHKTTPRFFRVPFF